MIIYNVTVNVEDSITEDWLTYMTKTHIPDVMNTMCFKSFSLNRIISRQEDETGMTFTVQYRCENMEFYQTYQEKYAAGFQKEHNDKFEGKYVAFRTLMEEIA